MRRQREGEIREDKGHHFKGLKPTMVKNAVKEHRMGLLDQG